MNPDPAPPNPAATTALACAALGDERRFLAVLSGSPQDEALLRYAAFWTAARRPAGEMLPAAPLLGVTVLAGRTRQGAAVVVTAPQAVQTLPPSAEARTPVAAVLRRAAAGGVDGLVVGDGDGRRLAGDLLRHAACPVWFVPGGALPTVRRVLVPVDFSVRAADSLRVAATLARLSGAAECVALHVYFNDSFLTGPWGERATRQATETAFARFMKPIDTLGVTVTPCFREAADVPRAINEAAAECQADLIVLASRGRTWTAALLQPTVAEQTLRTCRVPLLVVKHFGAARGFLNLLVERLRGPGLRCN